MQIASYGKRASRGLASLVSMASVRPIVILQSDDWGRVGTPSLDALKRIRSRYPEAGRNPWDFYGLESENDIVSLGDILAAARDKDGRSACMTTNFIMANADLRAMRANGNTEFVWIGITDGFPAPWTEKLLSAYLGNIDRKVFYPGLHGFTHFNIPRLLSALRSDSAQGDLARALVAEDIPYLASLTPEYNFALVARDREARFLDESEQTTWIMQGVTLFKKAFGFLPRTTCAPGYRANETTFRVWSEIGIEAVQSGEGLGIGSAEKILVLGRNVHFEPALAPDAAIDKSIRQAESAVLQGFPIVVSTHSINYISRHLGRERQSREMLRDLLSRLLNRFPSLRFTSEADFIDAYGRKDPLLFRAANAKELAHRVAAAMKPPSGAIAGPTPIGFVA